jgi:hypothetical protein
MVDKLHELIAQPISGAGGEGITSMSDSSPGKKGKKAKGLQCPSRNHNTETGGAEVETHNSKAAVS